MTKFSGVAEKVIIAVLIGGPIIGGIVGDYVGRRNQWAGVSSSILGLAAGLIAAIVLLATLVLIERLLNHIRD